MTLDRRSRFSLVSLRHTLIEPVISAFKPINRPLKKDWSNGTTYNRTYLMTHK